MTHYSLQVSVQCADTGDTLRRRCLDAGTTLVSARLNAETLLAAAENQGFHIWQDDYGDGTETLVWHAFCDDDNDDELMLEVALVAEPVCLN